MTTRLRMIYEVLQSFSTATQINMCDDLTRQLMSTGKGNLAGYFAEALVKNQDFCQLDQPFIPANRSLKPGANPTFGMMKDISSTVPIMIMCDVDRYEFTVLEREVPHLRAIKLVEQPGKAWIDYVAHTVNRVPEERPILGEVKWHSDQNPFYALLQLLTYLSEIATPHQIQRSIQHSLFGTKITAITAFDLHIFLADFNDRGEKGKLIEPTYRLAKAFKTHLQHDSPAAASSLGNILCLSGHIEKESNSFSNLTCLWKV